jgi:hypothetical protein
MVILRVLGILLVIAITLCVGVGILTREPRCFTWAWRLCRAGVVVALVFMVLLVLERLAIFVL